MSIADLNNKNYAAWTVDQWESVFLNTNSFKGIFFHDSPTSPLEPLSEFSALEINPISSFTRDMVHQTSTFNYYFSSISDYSSYSLAINDYYGYFSGSISASVPLIGGGTIGRTRTSSGHQSNSHQKDYSVASYFIPKFSYAITNNLFRTTNEFNQDVLEILDNDSSADEKLNDFMNLLKTKWGEYISTKVLLGGSFSRIYSFNSTSTTNMMNAHEMIRANFDTIVKFMEISANIEHTAESSQTLKSQVAESISGVAVYGGNISSAYSFKDWSKSLGSAQYWGNIGRSDMAPIINFLPDHILYKVGELYVRNDTNGDYENKAVKYFYSQQSNPFG
ncbi:MACPF domain-containing protein [Sulfidibacter corallicola]|uniref:MACPF domain-containing protein n=1 Tax=Sulfidibacter corallicola TaxID=2818388 RepID=A0A8A4TQY4_SULCO|nr:MAC/perforin domain-containing protein [Sulfidibacter corallicola]QTD48935.1 hypothetical protein J3U87_25405 [Sulfidibacter corallicola]